MDLRLVGELLDQSTCVSGLLVGERGILVAELYEIIPQHYSIGRQAQAIQLGLTRLLCKMDKENRPILKPFGFLTRDSRIKERKKYGLRKARKAPQYSKR